METFPMPVLMDTAGYPSDPVVVAVGISLVFLILLLLTLIITLQGRFFDALEAKRRAKAAAKAKPAAVQQAAPAAPAPVVEEGIPEEVVAAIAAAVASMDGGKYTLRTVARADSGRGAWGNAGVVADTEPF